MVEEHTNHKNHNSYNNHNNNYHNNDTAKSLTALWVIQDSILKN